MKGAFYFRYLVYNGIVEHHSSYDSAKLALYNGDPVYLAIFPNECSPTEPFDEVPLTSKKEIRTAKSQLIKSYHASIYETDPLHRG